MSTGEGSGGPQRPMEDVSASMTALFYLAFKVGGGLLLLIGLSAVGSVFTTDDPFTLALALPCLFLGYLMVRRTVRLVCVGERALRFEGGGYHVTIVPEDIACVTQSGYPFVKSALILFWLQRSEARPRFLMTFNDPSRDLFALLRAWGKPIGDFGR